MLIALNWISSPAAGRRVLGARPHGRPHIFPRRSCRKIVTAASGSHPLIDFVNKTGGGAEGVALVDSGGSGWGLRSAQVAKAGTVLIDLPQSLHLTLDETCPPALAGLIEKVPAELWGARLGLRLLSERAKGEESLFHPYISHLPMSFEGIPMFFSPNAMAQIQYPPLSEQVKMRCRWLLSFSSSELATAPADIFGGQNVDANALGWAWAATTSRAFRTRGPKEPASLLPLIDMCNHSLQPNVAIQPGQGGNVKLVTQRELEAGEPLLLNYGPLSNDFLFGDYGFVVPDNPHDRVELRFDATLLAMGRELAGLQDIVPLGAQAGGAGAEGPPSLALAPWQEELMVELRLVGPAADPNLSIGKNSVDPRLLAGLRILFANEKRDLDGYSLDRLQKWDEIVGRENEERAMKTLASCCAVALANFTSSLDTDRRILEAASEGGALKDEGSKVDVDVLLAVRFRAEKKAILTDAVTRAGERLTGLATLKQDAPRSGMTSKGFGKKEG